MAGFPSAYRRPEVQRALQAIREAVARHHREGIHYLRLDAAEFSYLYAALGRELRASYTVWHKLQAMCQQGRLL